jgi:hypothetical protein
MVVRNAMKWLLGHQRQDTEGFMVIAPGSEMVSPSRDSSRGDEDRCSQTKSRFMIYMLRLLSLRASAVKPLRLLDGA